MQTLWSHRLEIAPAVLVIVVGAFDRALDEASTSLAVRVAVEAVAVALLLAGLYTVRRRQLLTMLWAVMAVSAAIALARTMTLALPEDDVILLRRQTNLAVGTISVVGYTMLVALAAWFGSKSIRHGFLVIATYAAVFAPTWPFLSPGASEPAYFVIRWILVVVCIASLAAVVTAVRSFNERTPDWQRRAVVVLFGLATVRTALAYSPIAFTSPLRGLDSIFFGVGGFAVIQGVVLGVTWLAVRARASSSPS